MLTRLLFFLVACIFFSSKKTGTSPSITGQWEWVKSTGGLEELYKHRKARERPGNSYLSTIIAIRNPATLCRQGMEPMTYLSFPAPGPGTKSLIFQGMAQLPTELILYLKTVWGYLVMQYQMDLTMSWYGGKFRVVNFLKS